MTAYERDNRSVLVIDDNDIDREVMLELLATRGYRTSGLPSPIGATRELRRCQAGCVIIDQNMPGMDGHKLINLFRSNPATANVRVVLVSGDDEASMQELVRDANADAFVCKSDLHTLLLPTLQGVLMKRRNSQPPA